MVRMEGVTNFWSRCRAWDITQKGEEFLKFVGPGLLVTVGFIDPGNWAANLAAGAEYGYALLWMVTLSTLMLIVLQHNAAHLGIVTGKCMAEAITEYFPRKLGVFVLLTALGASAMTSMAEILGGAIALRMLFSIPLPVGATLTAGVAAGLLLLNSYSKVEKWIIGFVSVIGMAFLYELWLVPHGWVPEAAIGWVLPRFPEGSMLVIMSVLGAVVMPHNLFLHSEIIQSRQWNLEGEAVIKKRLDYEFFDTLFAMLVGWAINSAMIILAAATFWKVGQSVSELEQAKDLLTPLLGEGASVIFAVALLFAGVASSVTSGMAGGIIASGMAGEPYSTRDKHSICGILGSLGCGLALIWMTSDPFKGLLYSQMALSVQLPITMLALVSLTSSPKVMGKYANAPGTKLLLLVLTGIVTALNVMLLVSALQ
jgi:manganese transport protein